MLDLNPMRYARGHLSGSLRPQALAIAAAMLAFGVHAHADVARRVGNYRIIVVIRKWEMNIVAGAKMENELSRPWKMENEESLLWRFLLL